MRRKKLACEEEEREGDQRKRRNTGDTKSKDKSGRREDTQGE